MVSGLQVITDAAPGWIGLVCGGDAMALWLLKAIVVENVVARREGNVLFLPAGPAFRIDHEIKNVVTLVAKTSHYWLEHSTGAIDAGIANSAWYSGRAVHIHFKIRTTTSSNQSYEFTSQLFFDDALSDQVFTQQPYAAKGQRNTLNSNDGIYSSQLLLTVAQSAQGYLATFDIGLNIA